MVNPEFGSYIETLPGHTGASVITKLMEWISVILN
ncbi:hypothetical protein ES703_61706 [subsurface metagenome]